MARLLSRTLRPAKSDPDRLRRRRARSHFRPRRGTPRENRRAARWPTFISRMNRASTSAGSPPRISHPAQPRRALLAHRRIRPRRHARARSPRHAGRRRPQFAAPPELRGKTRPRRATRRLRLRSRRPRPLGQSKPVARRTRRKRFSPKSAARFFMFQETAPQLRELDRAKRQSLLHQVHSQKTMSGKAASLGRGWLYQRDPHLSARYHEHVQAVTPGGNPRRGPPLFPHQARKPRSRWSRKRKTSAAATPAREARPGRSATHPSWRLGRHVVPRPSTCRSTRCRSFPSAPPCPAAC